MHQHFGFRDRSDTEMSILKTVALSCNFLIKLVIPYIYKYR